MSPLRLISSSDAMRHWLLRLIAAFLILFTYRLATVEVNMRTYPRINFIALVAASLARHGKAGTTIDLSWHAPISTVINNLSKVVEGDNIYGWIYDSSTTDNSEYGVYNWCNMPHVRKTEYPKPSLGYNLQYVEVVRSLGVKLVLFFQ